MECSICGGTLNADDPESEWYIEGDELQHTYSRDCKVVFHTRLSAPEAELAGLKAENEMLQSIVDEWSSWDYEEQCHVCGRTLPAKRIWHVDSSEHGVNTREDVTAICVDCVLKHMKHIL